MSMVDDNLRDVNKAMDRIFGFLMFLFWIIHLILPTVSIITFVCGFLIGGSTAMLFRRKI